MDSYMRVERCWDVSTIYTIIHDPILWNAATEDNPPEYIPDVVKDIYLSAIVENLIVGFWKFNQITSVTWEAHSNILKPYRDMHARPAAKAMLTWALENLSNLEKLICIVPEKYSNVRKFAEYFGFKIEGFNRKSFLKDGKLIGQHQMGITKEELINRLKEK